MSENAVGLMVVFGVSVASIIALYILTAESALAAVWIFLCMRSDTTVIVHESKAALLAKQMRPDGVTVLTVGAADGQIGRFARFELIRVERAATEETLLVRVFTRVERNEVLHELPGARALLRNQVDVTPTWDVKSEGLGREALPGVVAEAVRSFAHQASLSSGVIALTGPWGTGKSWVLDRLVEELECADPSRTPVRTLKFNPWLYSDEGSLFAGFAQMLASEAPSRRARSRLLKALKVIGPAAKLGPIDLAGVMSNVANAVDREFEDASAVTVEVTKSIRRKGPLCIVIDDVDRLTTDELLTLFKLVRLLGNVPNLNYVLAFDEQLVLSLLTRTSFATDNPVRARAFLEKIVDRKIGVPPLTASQIRTRVVEPLRRYPAEEGLRVRDGSIDRMEQVLSTVLVPEQVTIRSAERFVNAAQSLPKELHGEVDWADWVIVAWLRVFVPTLWIWITENRDDLVGSPRRFSPLEKQPSLDGARVLKNLGFDVPMTYILQDVLEALFPVVEQVSANIFNPRATKEEAVRRQGIGAKGYFDRYVWGTLPPGQLPDMRIVIELRRLTVDDSGQLTGDSGVRRLFEEDHEAVEQMIAANEGDAQIDPIAVLEFLSRLFDRNGIEEGVNRFLARSIAVRTFYDVDDDGRTQLLRQANRHPVLWWDLLSGVRREELAPEMVKWVTPLLRLRDTAVQKLVSSLKAGEAPSFANLERLQAFWDLRAIDLAMANRLLVEQVDDERWPLIDAIGALVKVYGKRDQYSLRGLPIDEVVAIFGQERLVQRIDSFEAFSRTRDYWDTGSSFDSVPATAESLRDIVVGGLLQWREYGLARPSGAEL